MSKKLAAGSWQLAASRKNESSLPTANCLLPTSSRGFTLIELVVTLMILTILTMGAIPLIKVSVRRQKEQQLREALHEIRTAIDQFHREALAGAQLQQQGQQQGQQQQPGQQPGQQQQQVQALVDPRIRVGITDNTIFGTDNIDRYPPDLETLVNGVSVTPLAQPAGAGGRGIAGLDNDRGATSNTLTSTKKKVYLREIPVDPMTGERDWDLRSVFDSKDATSWGGENVFDVRSKSNATALNGEKYSDW
ncbi:MAG: ral secretion pathway protein [Acidobacteriota bacterium]|nr:ral secretion pathway protein [Acidobacteriota bacterium]